MEVVWTCVMLWLPRVAILMAGDNKSGQNVKQIFCSLVMFPVCCVGSLYGIQKYPEEYLQKNHLLLF